MSDDRNAAIRARAYELWEAEGRPDGRDEQHWHDAARGVADDAPAEAEPADSPASAPKVTTPGPQADTDVGPEVAPAVAPAAAPAAGTAKKPRAAKAKATK